MYEVAKKSASRKWFQLYLYSWQRIECSNVRRRKNGKPNETTQRISIKNWILFFFYASLCFTIYRVRSHWVRECVCVSLSQCVCVHVIGVLCDLVCFWFCTRCALHNWNERKMRTNKNHQNIKTEQKTSRTGERRTRSGVGWGECGRVQPMRISSSILIVVSL